MNYINFIEGFIVGATFLTVFNQFFVIRKREHGEWLRFYTPNWHRDGFFEIPSTEEGEKIVSSIIGRNHSGPIGKPIEKPPSSNQGTGGPYL